MSTAHAAVLETPTGIPSNKLAMWLFLVSEVMFFTAFIAAYVVLRIGHPAWPGPEGHLSIGLGTLNTLILLASSFTMVLAHAAVVRDQQSPLKLHLFLTVALGSLFLGVKGFEYSQKFAHHIGPATNVFWSSYFTLTGFHALHVLGGVLTNAWFLMRAFQGRLNPKTGYGVELAGLYWHFVDIVWLFVFPLIYLI
jgi:heme/copper-type cytochrome/quinol oxidase subunit 3